MQQTRLYLNYCYRLFFLPNQILNGLKKSTLWPRKSSLSEVEEGTSSSILGVFRLSYPQKDGGRGCQKKQRVPKSPKFSFGILCLGKFSGNFSIDESEDVCLKSLNHNAIKK